MVLRDPFLLGKCQHLITVLLRIDRAKLHPQMSGVALRKELGEEEDLELLAILKHLSDQPELRIHKHLCSKDKEGLVL